MPASLKEFVKFENVSNFRFSRFIISRVVSSRDCKDNVIALNKSAACNSCTVGMIFSDENFAQFVRNVCGYPFFSFSSFSFVAIRLSLS